ncbi:MAG: hypothetical protein ACRDSL_13005 [Pseudonocardiaceae bacterium]
MTQLSSVRAGRRLEPLADVLESRCGSDYADLARTAPAGRHDRSLSCLTGDGL